MYITNNIHCSKLHNYRSITEGTVSYTNGRLHLVMSIVQSSQHETTGTILGYKPIVTVIFSCWETNFHLKKIFRLFSILIKLIMQHYSDDIFPSP